MIKYIRPIGILFCVLLFGCLLQGCQREIQMQGGPDPIPEKIQFSFSLAATHHSGVAVTQEETETRALKGKYNDSSVDPYIHSLWMLTFASDGKRYREPVEVKDDDLLAGKFWFAPGEMNYGDEYHCYFITNHSDAQIDLSKFKKEEDLISYTWDLTKVVGDPKKLFTMNEFPAIRILVAGYKIGIESIEEGGRIYAKRISPVGYEDSEKTYATNILTTHIMVLPIELVRTYSSIQVTMTRNTELEDKNKSVFKQENDIYTTFSFLGYAKMASLFGKTSKPEEEEQILTELDYKVKLVGQEGALNWTPSKNNPANSEANIAFWFPSVQQVEDEVTTTLETKRQDGTTVREDITYNRPCLDISYKHASKEMTTPATLHIYVNSNNKRVFKPNYIYGLPITFYPDVQNIWLVRMRNILREEANGINFENFKTDNWVVRSFANELELTETKEYPYGNNKQKSHFYSLGKIFYGNMYRYATVIETMSIGGPAYVVKEKSPEWLKEVTLLDTKVSNDQSTLIYNQLWCLTPQEIESDNHILRGDIHFRNKYGSQNASQDVIVHASFNVLARVAQMNLGDLNKFANGTSTEFNEENRATFTDNDLGLYGKTYQWGRNVPIDFTVENYAYNRKPEYWAFTEASYIVNPAVDFGKSDDDLSDGDLIDIQKIWEKTGAGNDKTSPYIISHAKGYRNRMFELDLDADPDFPTDAREALKTALKSVDNLYLPLKDEDKKKIVEYLNKKTGNVENYNKSRKYNRLNWFVTGRDSELDGDSNQWAYVVNKVYNKYQRFAGRKGFVAPGKDYIGNNGGDPCPGGGTYKYYSLPTNRDFAYIFYNGIREAGRIDKEVMSEFLQGDQGVTITEKALNPGGNPQTSNSDMPAYYRKAGGKIYALRFIGTKWQSFFVYEIGIFGDVQGLKITVAPTPSDVSVSDLKAMVDNQKLAWGDESEKRTRFFPFSATFNSSQNELKFNVFDNPYPNKKNIEKTKYYWGIWNQEYRSEYDNGTPKEGSFKLDPSYKWSIVPLQHDYRFIPRAKTNSQAQAALYSDYLLNTLSWVEDKKMYYVFDFDMDASMLNPDKNGEGPFFLATTTVAGPLRCIRR